MTRTLTVEGDVTAADTATDLTTQGSVTSPSRVIPSDVSRIDKIIVGVAAELSGAGDAGYHITLGGSAVMRGAQKISVGAQGGQTPQTGSDQASSGVINFILENADIEVAPSEVIDVQAEMCGDDLGTARVVVTLVFA